MPPQTPGPQAPSLCTSRRRSFVKAMLGAASFWMLEESTAWRKALAAETRIPYQPTFLTETEYRFVEAACERILPEDRNGPGAQQLGVAEFIDRQLETSYGHGLNWYMSGPFKEGPDNLGYQLPFVPRALYRLGIAAVNDHSQQHYGKVFAELSPTDQDIILSALENKSVTLGKIPGHLFFEQLRTNTLEGAFADPLYGGNKAMGGWLMVGFPGARADYMDWVNQNGAAYPLGPASLSGETA